MDYHEIRYFNNLPDILSCGKESTESGVNKLVRLSFKESKMKFEEILDALKKCDYCVISFDSKISLDSFAISAEPYLGKLISQAPNKNSYIYDVEYNPQKALGKMQLNSNRSQPLHTDGHFKVNPPNYIGLYCCERPKEGGLSKLVFVDKIHCYLRNISPEILKQLFEVDIEYFRRGPTNSLFKYKKKLLFSRVDGKVCISYNPIMRRIESENFIEQALILINYFTNRPSNQLSFVLQPNEMLLLDNRRVLHGRSRFGSNSRRKLQRLWFTGCDE